MGGELLAASTFSTLDWVIVSAYLLGTVFIGIWANRYIRDMADYAVAGRTLGTSVGVATMLGSEIGLVTVMYSAEAGFTSGFAAFHIGVVAGIACLVVGATGFIVARLRREEVKTIPEYYGKRFGKRARVLGGVMMAVAGILNMGVFLKTGALFLGGLTGLTDPLAINLIMTGLLALVLLYTVLGGMVSVVITDYIQFIVLSFGLLLCCLIAVQHLGWQLIVDDSRAFHGDAGVNPFATDGFGASYVVWSFFVFGLVSCAIWPTAVMRALSAKDEKTVKRLYQWSAIGFVTRIVLPNFLGICALVFFMESDVLRDQFISTDGKLLSDADQSMLATPVFLSHILPIGIMGLIAAAMLAAFMSTNDSYLLCWAVVIVEDVIDPLLEESLETKTKLLLARCFIVLIGFFLLVFGLYYPLNGNLIRYLAISGAIYFSGAFAVLVFGLYWKGASRRGAIAALLCGGFAIFGLEPIRKGLMIDKYVQEHHVGLATVVLSVVAMVVASVIWPDQRSAKETTLSNYLNEYDPDRRWGRRQ